MPALIAVAWRDMRWLYVPLGLLMVVVGVSHHLPLLAALGVILPTLQITAWSARRREEVAARHRASGGALPQALELEVDEIEAELRFGLECLWIEYADDRLTIAELESCAERQYAMYDAEIEKVDGRRRLWAIRRDVREPRPGEATAVINMLVDHARDFPPPKPKDAATSARPHVDTSHCQCKHCQWSRTPLFDKPRMEETEC